MDTQIAELKNKTVTYNGYNNGRTGSGDKAYKPSVDVEVVLFGKLNTIYTANGMQITTKHVMYVDGNDVQSMSNDDVFIIDKLYIPVGTLAPFLNSDGTVDYWEVLL
jgi:hypothetical protein